MEDVLERYERYTHTALNGTNNDSEVLHHFSYIISLSTQYIMITMKKKTLIKSGF